MGIIIGAGIFETSPAIAGLVPNLKWLVAVWLAGGVFSLVGALCYAELATAIPCEGGDYVFLNRAYGRYVGFLFAWCELWIVRPASIGMMAFVFARYAQALAPISFEAAELPGELASTLPLLIYAVAAVVVLTGINLLGVRQGKWTQNILTILKVSALAAIVVVGFFAAGPRLPDAVSTKTPSLNLGLAMVFVLFTYGGWNEMAYVGAEVVNPRRNIVRSLILGTLAVTSLYLLVNLAFATGLGWDGFRQSQAVASDLLARVLGPAAGKVIAVVICIAALGSANGQIFTGARVYYAMGQDHAMFRALGRWNPNRDAPVASLLIQAAVTLALVIGFGWYNTGFENLLIFSSPVFWTFFFLTGFSVVVLRIRRPDLERPFRVPFGPVFPLLFCGGCAYMIYSCVMYAVNNGTYEAFWALGALALGIVLGVFAVWRLRSAA
ncbi:amino acid permease [Thermostilla marina]